MARDEAIASTTETGDAALLDLDALAPESTVRFKYLVMNLIAGGLGTGMFSLPWSTAGASVVAGVFMTILVVALNAWTITILVAASEEHQVFDIGGLMGLLGGKLLPGRIGQRLPSLGALMQTFINIMVWVALMGSLTTYIIVMHDNAKPFLKGTFFGQSREPLVTAAAAIVLPLCFLDQRWLSCTSTVAVVVNIYLILVIFFLFGKRIVADDMPRDICYLGIGKGTIAMLAAVSQCIIIQMCALPMYKELENRTPERFNRAVCIAFSSLALFYGVFAALGYVTFGPKVHSDLLIGFPKGGFADVARIGVIAIAAAIYPIMVIPMVAPLRSLGAESLASPGTAPATVERRRCLLVTVAVFMIVLISYIGALSIESLGVLNVVNGAMCVGVFTALAPSLVGLYLLEMSSRLWRLKMYALLAFGALVAVLGLIYPGSYTSDLICVGQHLAAVV